MRTSNFVVCVIVSALLLAGAGVSHLMAGAPGEQRYHECIDLIRRIQQLSSRWENEIARVRIDRFADFDTLSAFGPRMRHLKNLLREQARRPPDMPEQMLESVDVYVRAIDEKEVHVERFKTTYAVVRNSTRYMPLAAANVVDMANSTGEESLAQVVELVTREMKAYLSAPTRNAHTRLSRVLDEMRQANASYEPALSHALGNLVAHMNVLLSRYAPMNELFRMATSDELSDLGIRLSQDMEAQIGKSSIVAENYRHVSVAVVAALVTFWAVVAIRRTKRKLEPLPKTDREETALRKQATEATGHESEAPSESVPTTAESAILYTFLVQRSGQNILSMVRKIPARLDSLRQSQQRIALALQAAEPMPGSPDGETLDDEVCETLRIAAELHRDVDGIADFGRQLASFKTLPHDTDQRNVADVNACMDEVVAATGADRAADVRRRYGEVRPAPVPQSDLRVALTQILVNALQAMEELEDRVGTITIATSSTSRALSITITDNGPGMSSERQETAFKPFHSSRDGAMGIGLPMTAELVRRHKGIVRLRSRLGRGTMVRVSLPVRDEQADTTLS